MYKAKPKQCLTTKVSLFTKCYKKNRQLQHKKKVLTADRNALIVD